MLAFMKYLLSLGFLLFITLPTQAEIYRSVDEDGNVIYSDQELPNSELIPTPTDNAIPMPKPEAKPPAEDVVEKPASAYQSFSIASPANNAVIRDNAGNVTVSLSIMPELKAGDYIRLYVDNKLVMPRLTSSGTQLSNLTRGTHSLKAELMSSSGQSFSTTSVRFHLQRFSVLH